MPDSLPSTDEARRAPGPSADPAAVRIVAGGAQGEARAGGLVVRHATTGSASFALEFHDIGLDAALADTDGARPGDSATLVTLISLAAGARTPYETQKRAEAWMASRRGESGAPFETTYRSERVLWRRGRALCVGTGEFQRDVRDAIAYFSHCERELDRLEARVAALWPAVEADLPLTHSVGRPELRRQQAVDARTREAHALRLDFVRLSGALERLDPALSAPSRRVVSELLVQAETVDRLRLLDEGIEFAQETYDTANDRLLEYRYFSTEYAIEIVIAVVLLVELLVVAAEVLRNW